MKKYFILYLLICVGFMFGTEVKRGTFSGTKVVHLPTYTMSSFLDLKEDIDTLSTANKTLILFVHQQNCPYCAKFVQKNLNNQEIKTKILKDFGLVEFDMFGSRDVVGLQDEELSEKEYAKILKLQFTPTILFFDNNGNIVLKLAGLVPLKKFSLALDYVSSKKYKIIGFNDFLNNNLNDMVNNKKIKNRSLVKEDFFIKNPYMLARMGHKEELAVFFEKENCKACERFHRTHLKDTIIRKLLQRIEVAQLDIHQKQTIANPKKIIMKQKDWIKDLKITSIPTIIFFDKNGDEIIRMDSRLKLFHTQSVIDYVVSGAYKTEKEFQRYLTNRSNAIRDQGIDVDIWK